MKAKIATYAMAFVVLSVLPAASETVRPTKVYVGSDGLAHVVDSKGKDRTIPRENQQVAVSAPKLAADNQTAGWLVEQDNCCTSYTIPTRLIIYRQGKKRVVSDNLMIYDWCFVGEGSQVALSTGTVHFQRLRHLLLYDSRNGKLLVEWSGDHPDKTPPAWANALTQ